MDNFSQLNLKVPATEPEHVVRKAELDHFLDEFHFGRCVFIARTLDRDTEGLWRVRLYGPKGIPDGPILEGVRMIEELDDGELDTIAGQNVFYNSFRHVEII